MLLFQLQHLVTIWCGSTPSGVKSWTEQQYVGSENCVLIRVTTLSWPILKSATQWVQLRWYQVPKRRSESRNSNTGLDHRLISRQRSATVSCMRDGWKKKFDSERIRLTVQHRQVQIQPSGPMMTNLSLRRRVNGQKAMVFFSLLKVVAIQCERWASRGRGRNIALTNASAKIGGKGKGYRKVTTVNDMVKFTVEQENEDEASPRLTREREQRVWHVCRQYK